MKLNSFSFSSKVCIAAMLFVFTACAMESTYEKPDTLLSGYDKVNTSSGKADSCFDQRLETWFQAFNQYQSEGYDMFESDKKAWEEADAKALACWKRK